MTDIHKLIEKIHNYKAAREAYDNDRSEDNGVALEHATIKLTGEYYAGEEIREAFTALADHAQALQARIDAALAICDTNYTDSKGEYRDGVNNARDEIYDVLTGKSE